MEVLEGRLWLPNEILDKICACLCWHCHGHYDKRRVRCYGCGDDHGHLKSPLVQHSGTLAALCCTSKKLYMVAIDHLYHLIEVDSRSYARREGYVMSMITPLVRTLMAKPSLGHATRTLILDSITTNFSETDVALYQELALRYSLEFPADWSRNDGEARRANMQQEQAHVLALLLLFQFPNLERLSLIAGSGVNVLSDLALDKSEIDMPSLEALKTLAIDSNDPEMSFSLGEAAPILHLAPNLSTLFASSCEGTSGGLQTKNITDLHLSEASLSGPDLERLISSCLQLRSFMYFFDDRGSPDIEPQPSALVRILHERHRGSLQTLVLDIESLEDQWTSDSIITRMPEFARLENLLLAAETFTEPDGELNGIHLLRTLPQTLKRAFFLNSNRHMIRADILRIANEVASGSYPDLKEIGLHCQGDGYFIPDTIGQSDAKVTERQIDEELGPAFLKSGVAWVRVPNLWVDW